MRIGMATNSYLPSIGGKQIEVSLISKSLAEKGNSVFVIVPTAKGQEVKDIQQNLVIYRYPVPWQSIFRPIPVLTYYSYVMHTLKYLLSFVKENEIEVLHAHDLTSMAPFAIAVAETLSIPVVTQAHGSDILSLQRRRADPIYSVFKTLLKRADRVVVNGSYAKEDLGKMGIAREKIVIIPCPISLSSFEEVAISEAQTGKQVKRIVTVANCIREKGLIYLIKAAGIISSRINDVEFLIVGRAIDKALYSRLLREIETLNLGEKVRFLGGRSHVETLRILCSADVFVLPSVYDQLPIALLEAMAAGKPVVATKVCGIPDVVRDRMNGLLINPRDPTALANAIQEILSDEDLRGKLSSNARSSALQYDARVIAGKHLRVYEEILCDK